MPDRPSSLVAALRQPIPLLPSLTFCLCFSLAGVDPVSAEVRIVRSQGEFRLGDRDTREDAMRLATEAAKRNALEQVATYLESVTVIEDSDITRDEIKTYTAGLILVLDQQANMWLDGDGVVITVDLTSQIDTEEVARAILVLRENEEARHQLATLRTELDELHKELEAASLSLGAAATAEEAQLASIQRQDLLNRVQSNARVSQVWTDWAAQHTLGLTTAATELSAPARPFVESFGTRPMPLTLNEISHTTSTAAVQFGTQSPRARAMVPVPMLPRGPAPGQQIPSFGSRSVRSLQQFLQPPGRAPITRRLPPSLHHHAPSLLPRGSYRLPPRGFGGHSGGVGRGGMGGRGGGGRGGGRGR